MFEKKSGNSFTQTIIKLFAVFLLTLPTPCLGIQPQLNDPPPNDRKSALKIPLLDPLCGIIPVSWESSISKNTSVEFSAGLTFSEINRLPWCHNQHQGGLNNFGYLHWSMKTRSESELGVMAEAGFRFYAPSRKGAMNGFYLAPKMQFVRYNYSLTGIDANQEDVIESRRSWDNRYGINLEAGYQVWFRRFCFDAQIGVHSSLVQLNQLSAMQHWYDSQWNFYWYEEKTNFIHANGYLGLNVGYSF